MGPILTFLIILINNLEKSEARAASFIGTLTPMKNGLSGEIHSTDDEMFLEIKNFTYDGKGPFTYYVMVFFPIFDSPLPLCYTLLCFLKPPFTIT